MLRLTRLEQAELIVLPVMILGTWLAPWPASVTVRLGTLVTAASLLLLLQGFCRDVWLWLAARRDPSPPAPHYARCLCVESALGLTGILAAAGLAVLQLGPEFTLSRLWLTPAVAAVLLLGFLLKDFVFEWSPWRLYRAKDHASLHFRWRP